MIVPSTSTGTGTGPNEVPKSTTDGPEPLVHIPADTTDSLLKDIVSAYLADAWLAEKHLDALTRHDNGLWLHDSKIVVPDVGVIKRY